MREFFLLMPVRECAVLLYALLCWIDLVLSRSILASLAFLRFQKVTETWTCAFQVQRWEYSDHIFPRVTPPPSLIAYWIQMTSGSPPICSSANTLQLMLCTTGFSPYDNGESPPWAIRQIGRGRGNPNALRDSRWSPYNSRSVSLTLAVCWTQLSAPCTGGSLFIKDCCIRETGNYLNQYCFSDNWGPA